MQHWEKVLIGTIAGVVTTVIFYLLFDQILKYCYKNPNRQLPSPASLPSVASARALRIKPSPELERFVHEEFESSRHECVVVVCFNGSLCAGICAFLQDRTIEYFREAVPACCLQSHHSDPDSGQMTLRLALAAISAWGPKWHLADAVNFLTNDRHFVLQVNSKATPAAKFVHQMETKFQFPLFCQWIDNFMCDDGANSELWDEMIISVNKLIQSRNDVWTDFPCEEWHRQLIHVNGQNFHQLPHPGQIVDTPKLIDI